MVTDKVLVLVSTLLLNRINIIVADPYNCVGCNNKWVIYKQELMEISGNFIVDGTSYWLKDSIARELERFAWG